jgi:hypothetical protein
MSSVNLPLKRLLQANMVRSNDFSQLTAKAVTPSYYGTE